MFYMQLAQLCERDHIAISTFVTEKLHMSKGNIAGWKQGQTPSATTIQKIAEYFGVTTDYLLTGTEAKEKPTKINGRLGPRGKEIYKRLEKIEKINPDRYKQAIDYLDYLINRQDKKDK